MSKRNTATIYDVIDNFWGRDPLRKIMRSDKIAFQRFAKEVNRFYASYMPPESADSELRTYYGGLVAVNFSLAGKQTTFFNNLLYAHSTIIPDPIARWYFDDYEQLSKTPRAEYGGGRAAVDQSEWIGWLLNSHRALQWDLEASREVMHFFVSGLMRIRSLVEAGIIILISQAHLLLSASNRIVNQALADAASTEFRSAMVEIDEKLPLWDNSRGGIMTPTVEEEQEPLTVEWAKAKEAAYHIHKNLAIAAAAAGHYIPENATDYGLLKAVLSTSGQRLGISEWKFETARNIKDLRIPSLEGLPLTELIAIRKNSSAFEEFRNWLARRLLSVDPNLGNSMVELTSEELTTELDKLRSQLGTSQVIKTHVKEDGLKIVIGALVGTAFAASVGAPLAGALAGALGGVASALFKRDQLVSKSVFAQLVQINRTSPDATFGKEGKPTGLPRALAQPFFGEVRIGPTVNEEQPYTPKRLREIVSQSMQPNATGNSYRAIGIEP